MMFCLNHLEMVDREALTEGEPLEHIQTMEGIFFFMSWSQIEECENNVLVEVKGRTTFGKK